MTSLARTIFRIIADKTGTYREPTKFEVGSVARGILASKSPVPLKDVPLDALIDMSTT
jgi:hypothetical protein